MHHFEFGIAVNKWKIIFRIVGTPLIPSLPACAVSWLTFCSTYRDRLSNFINESRGKKREDLTKSRGKCTILDSQEKASNDPVSFNVVI